MSHDERNDDAPALYVSFDKKSLSDKKLVHKIKTCQSRNRLTSLWVDDVNILILQGSEKAMQSAQEEINHYAGCEAHIYTSEQLDQMDDDQDIQFDPTNDRILAIYLFAPEYLETIKNNANPRKLVSEFTAMSAETYDVQADINTMLDQASEICQFSTVSDTSMSSVLIAGSKQDIYAVQKHMSPSYATVIMTYEQYQRGLQPWETLKKSSPILH